MNIKKICLVYFVLALMTILTVNGAPTIQQTVARINADANKPGGTEAVLKSISASTHVPVATLEKQKAKSGLSYGDVFIAHSVARASGKSFDEIAGRKAKGESWDKIADDNNVSLGGKKPANNTAAANAKATPTPHKTLAEEQRERLSQPHAVTNAPKPK